MSRRGFTLVEVLIALMVAGVGMLAAHGLFTAVVDGARRVGASRLELDRWANAHRLLGSILWSVEVGPPPAAPFEGHANRMEFSAWLPTVDGWFERGAVRVGLEGGQMIAESPAAGRTTLSDSLVALRFDYLLEPGVNARWVSDWVSPVSPPLAVRVRWTRKSSLGKVMADTSLYPIGVGR